MTKPSATPWEEPTLTEAFIDGATGRIPGTPTLQLRGVVLGCLLIAAVAWVMPSITEIGPRLLISGLIVSMFAGWTARHMQSRFGRSLEHQWAALAGFATVVAICVGILVVVSVAVGRTLDESPFGQLLISVLGDEPGRALAIFGATLVVIILVAVLYFLGPGRRRRAERNRLIDEAAQAEQSARAAAAAARNTEAAT